MRFWPALGALCLLLALAPAAQAGNATVTTNCAGLQAALNDTSKGTVILQGICVGSSFTLARALVLDGDPSDGPDGFDGSGAPDAVLTVTNPGSLTISDLLFRDSTRAGSGGALSISGTAGAVLLARNTFLGNSTTASGAGGALAISVAGTSGDVVDLVDNTFGSLAEPNTAAGDGGGAFVVANNSQISLTGNTFRGNESQAGNGGGLFVARGSGSLSTITFNANVFDQNQAALGGGGAYLAASGSPATVTGNQFVANGLTGAAEHLGAGLYADTPRPLTQSLNLFDSNEISGGQPTSGGGGEYIRADDPVSSTSDRWIRNSVVPTSGGRGGGLIVEAFGAPATARVENGVVAGNSIGGAGQGGGVFLPSAGGCVFRGTTDCTELELVNATVSGNSVGAGGSGNGVAGSGAGLSVQNSILLGNSGSATEATGVQVVASFSDVCGVGGAPFTGAGNICAVPHLADPANGDAHQTAASPTLDAGSNALVPVALTEDFEGDGRVRDSDGDGSAVVDMGADEAGVFPPPAPPPPPPVVPPPPPPPPAGGPPPPPPPTPARPVLGRSAELRPVRGAVRFRRPGGSFTALRARTIVPFGTTVDARRGVVEVRTATNRGAGTQTGRFSLGAFILRQGRGNPLTDLVLTGGSFRRCGSASASALSKRRVRRLFGDARGKFRSRGRYSSATVRGTIWTTEDRCNGTLTKVRVGSVAVRDFGARRTITVRGGVRTRGRGGGPSSYLAGPGSR